MNKELMQKVASDLVALSKEYGTDESGNTKVMIPHHQDEPMEFIRKFSYKSQGSFSIDDPAVIKKARGLVQTHGEVWAVFNPGTLAFELYIPPDELNTTDYASSSSPSTAKTGGGCFIATACYGTDTAPDVLTLRNFRDRILLSSKTGRTFVDIYYLLSPPVANIIAPSYLLRSMVRKFFIQPIASLCRSKMKKN
jgi:hypothetical protein